MIQWPALPDGLRAARLAPPAPTADRPLPVVLDTDAYNEIDDQFCIAWAALEPRIDLQALYAAPFLNPRSTSPADGMEKSYEEIGRLLKLMGRCGDGWTFRGADRFMTGPQDAVANPASADLVARAMARPEGDPLYVLTIGCPVNVASALVTEPELVSRIVVVWLGGNPHGWPNAREFNCMQDVHASRTLFDSGVPLVQIPCFGVTDHLTVTIPELDYYLGDASPLGRYLGDCTKAYMLEHLHGQDPRSVAVSKVIWDVTAVAWCLMPGALPSRLTPAPRLQDDLSWSFDYARPLIREVMHVHRDPVFSALYRLLR